MNLLNKQPKLLKLLTFSIITMIYTSCAGFDHRDYSETMEAYDNDQLTFVPNIDFPVVAGDEGEYGGGIDVIVSRTPGYKEEKKLSTYEESIKMELHNLESNLDEQSQVDYIKYRSKLDSDSARIYYLSLQDPREKYRYLKVRGLIKESKERYYSSGERAIASLTNDVVLGMNKSDVKRIWGEPLRVDYSGQRSLENERWAYRRNDKVKFIFFDGGRVEGWTEQ